MASARSAAEQEDEGARQDAARPRHRERRRRAPLRAPGLAALRHDSQLRAAAAGWPPRSAPDLFYRVLDAELEAVARTARRSLRPSTSSIPEILRVPTRSAFIACSSAASAPPRPRPATPRPSAWQRSSAPTGSPASTAARTSSPGPSCSATTASRRGDSPSIRSTKCSRSTRTRSIVAFSPTRRRWPPTPARAASPPDSTPARSTRSSSAPAPAISARPVGLRRRAARPARRRPGVRPRRPGLRRGVAELARSADR